tara:strand:- start:228 stop:500 length:273 start_codon:yes stop_codon:yes gene_type:complete
MGSTPKIAKIAIAIITPEKAIRVRKLFNAKVLFILFHIIHIKKVAVIEMAEKAILSVIFRKKNPYPIIKIRVLTVLFKSIFIILYIVVIL